MIGVQDRAILVHIYSVLNKYTIVLQMKKDGYSYS